MNNLTKCNCAVLILALDRVLKQFPPTNVVLLNELARY